MKFALAAFLGLATAATRTELKDEMSALLELVQAVQTQDQTEIFEVIETRKNRIRGGRRTVRVANEARNMKAVVSKVLDNDFEGAVEELEARKDELMDQVLELQDEEAPVEGGEEAPVEGGEEAPVEGGEEAAPVEGGEAPTEGGAAEGETPAEGGNGLAIGLGIVGALVVLGGVGYCVRQRKNAGDNNEGGYKSNLINQC